MTGTERKVFQKYYPPDYDPSKLRKNKSAGGKRNRQFVQRVMTPFNMQCNTCHEYIYKGKKFNMKRETAEGETYLGLKIFRFYFKCPNCLAEITFKTDLENCDYQNEYGATRLFEAFKLYKEAERAKEAQEEEDKKDPMKMLEKRTMTSRAEMEAMVNLEDLQEMSRHKEGVNVEDYIQTSVVPTLTVAERLKRQEEADEKFIRDLYGKGEDGKIAKRLEDIEDDSDEEEDEEKPGTSSSAFVKEEPREDVKPDFKPPVSSEAIKRKMDQKSLLSKMVIVKKKKDTVKQEPEELAPVTPKTAPALLGLGDYGSSSDSD